MLAFLSVVDRGLFKILSIVGCCAIALLAGVCLYQVFSRFILEASTVWSEALARTLMVWAVFLGMPIALRKGLAITMSVAAEMAPRRVRAIINAIVVLAIAFTLGIMLLQGVMLLDRISNQRLAGLEVPIVWAYAAIPTGAAFGLIALVFNGVEKFRERSATMRSAFEGDTI